MSSPTANLRRLNVLHVSVPTSDGIARVAMGYVRDQVERGWHVTVACPSDGTLGYDARAAGARARWWAAGGERGPSLTREAAALRRIVEAANPDLVHLHGAKAGLVGRLVLRGSLPTVFQPHDWASQTGSGGTGGAGGSGGSGGSAASGGSGSTSWRWERFAARWTSELVCVSDSQRRLGEEHGVVVPATVLPHGVELDLLAPQGDGERRAARAALGLRAAPTVVCVGRLTLQRGQQDLLADWPSIRAQVPDAQLVLVGDGPDRDGLIRQAASLRGVSMVGHRSDVVRWYAAADVVVVPSRWDGMGLVPLEAMACERSVVVTSATGVAPTLPTEAGAVVPVEDSASLVRAVVERLSNPGQAEDEGWNGRSYVELNHDAAHSARDLARVYLRLVGTHRDR